MEAAKASAYALTVRLNPSTPAPKCLLQGWQHRRHDERVESYQIRGERTEDECPALRGPQPVGGSADRKHD
jgi:hypothetical protein